MSDLELPPPLSDREQLKITRSFMRTSGIVARGLLTKGPHDYYSHARKKLDAPLVNEIRRTARYLQDDPKNRATGLTESAYAVECGLVVGGLFAKTMLSTAQIPRFDRNITESLKLARSIPKQNTAYDILYLTARNGRLYADQFCQIVGKDALSLSEKEGSEGEQDDRSQTTYENAFGYMCAESVNVAVIDALRKQSRSARREQRELEDGAHEIESLDYLSTAFIDWLQPE